MLLCEAYDWGSKFFDISMQAEYNCATALSRR